MPFWRLYYHLVWSTKGREPLISLALESRLFPYIANKAQSLGCIVDAINGCEEHIHLVLSIPPKLSISNAVKNLKGASSHEFSELTWQRGYGVFSFGERQRHFAIEYVKNQKEHHAQQTTNPWLERSSDEDDE
jgi:putative transposase